MHCEANDTLSYVKIVPKVRRDVDSVFVCVEPTYKLHFELMSDVGCHLVSLVCTTEALKLSASEATANVIVLEIFDVEGWKAVQLQEMVVRDNVWVHVFFDQVLVA